MIKERKQLIEKTGLTWGIVESVPFHEAIMTRNNHFDLYLENYKKTLRNLAACGIRTICYSFTPMLDGARTELEKRWGNGAKTLYFDWVDLAVVDLKVSLR